jgi:5-methylcytosine-specific restriction endonuclease McrA
LETPTVYSGWMTAPANISRVERLRLRDGGLCWLCAKPIDFKAVPNSARAPTEEHLVAQCHDGPNRIENLVLCHPPCNKKLDNLPLAEKIRMREAVQRERWEADIIKRIARALVGNTD